MQCLLAPNSTLVHRFFNLNFMKVGNLGILFPVQSLAEHSSDMPFFQSLRNMLLFQYLVNALEGDFLPRNRVYEGIITCLVRMLFGTCEI